MVYTNNISALYGLMYIMTRELTNRENNVIVSDVSILKSSL